MTEQDFWEIIAARPTWKLLSPAKGAFGSGPEEIFVQNLAAFGIDDILSFGGFWQQCWKRTNREDLHAAAYIIELGCSDDAFYNGFRPGLICQGYQFFENVLRDSDSTLAALPLGGAEIDEGEFCHVIFDAFELRTGERISWEDLPEIPMVSDPPDRAVDWTTQDLPILFPKLWEKHKSKWKNVTLGRDR